MGATAEPVSCPSVVSCYCFLVLFLEGFLLLFLAVAVLSVLSRLKGGKQEIWRNKWKKTETTGVLNKAG
jgi:predicted membrane metal-binding protein